MQDTRVLLARALNSSNEHDAELVMRPSTDIGEHPAPFLRRFRILRIEPENPHRPLLFYVGFAPGREVYMLTGYPQNFLSLARADYVSLDSIESAVSFVTTYFEVTRSMSELTYLVGSVDDVRFRPVLDGTESVAKDEFLDKYRAVIEAPAVVHNRNFTVTVYLIHQQMLERHTVHVTVRGDLHDDVTVLERDLPLVYGA